MSALSESHARLSEQAENLDEKATLRARVVELERENDLLKPAQRAHTGAGGSQQKSGTEGTPERGFLQHIYGAAPIGLCYLDTKLRYLFVNEWLAAINGLSVKEHLGRPISEVLPDVAAGVEAQLRRVIETGEPIREGGVVAETAAQPGVKRHFEHHYDAVRSADGAVVGVSCVVQDVTERKRAEEALRKSQERFDLAVKGSNDGLWDWDIATGQEWWSPRFYELLGYEDREIDPTYARFVEALHPNDRDRTLEAVRAHLEDRVTYDVEYQLRMKSGEYRWFSGRGQALWNETGEALRMAGSIRDIHERRQEKEALRFTQFAVDHNSEATYWVKQDGSIFYVNQAACQALGYTYEELTSMTVPDIDPDFPRQAWADHWQEMKEARSMTFEAHHRTKAGRIFPVEILSDFVEYDGREYICAFVRDITQRRAAEQALKASETRYHDLYDNAPDMFCSVDAATGTVLECNQTLAGATGYTKKELIGRHISQLYHPDSEMDRQSVFKAFTQLGEVRDAELQLQRKDGSRLDVSLNISAVRDEQGNILRSRSIWRDITERKRAEQALRESESKYRGLFEAASDVICLVDGEGNIVDINRRGELLTGFSRAELCEMNVLDQLVVPEDRDIPRRILERAAPGEEPVYEVRWRTKDGRTIHFEGVTTFLFSPAAEFLSTRCTLRDITERKRAEEQKSLLKEQLHQSQKMEALGQLASGIAHDFNNLLMVVRNCADFLNDKEDLDGPDPREALSLIMGATAQASGVTRSLLAFAGKTTIGRIVVDLGSIVENLIGLLRHLLPATIEIVVDLPESPLWVLGDESQLQQVLMNLAINSRDAMPDGGVISITVDQVDGTARVTVKDTGVGISPELQSRIFEPFFSTKPRGDGTGLGLAIVHGIVKDHEGEIRVQSELGKGTTTTITLPRVQEPAHDAVPIPREIPRGQGQLVVLAEDRQHVRTVTELLLVALGYRVEAAADGAEALARFNNKRDQVELLILDMDMPRKTGVQCLEELRADSVDTPILLITVGHRLQRATDLLDGRTRILQKPFDIGDLGRAVSELLFRRCRAE